MAKNLGYERLDLGDTPTFHPLVQVCVTMSVALLKLRTAAFQFFARCVEQSTSFSLETSSTFPHLFHEEEQRKFKKLTLFLFGRLFERMVLEFLLAQIGHVLFFSLSLRLPSLTDATEEVVF